MADVYTVLFVMLGILISLPALLVALNLLLPRATGRAATRLTRTPGWSFVMGVPVTAAAGLWIAIATASGIGPLIGTAWVVGFGWMALGTIGAAGMARLLGERLSALSAPTSNLTTLVRGAVIYELACIFPIVGWFFFAPLVGITVVGAAVYGLLGWEPRSEREPAIDLVDNSAGLGEQVRA